MAQVGLHGIVAIAIRKWVPGRGWLMLGIVLGSLIPDLDNVAVAIATITRQSTAGLHRTATHSLFTSAAIFLFFYFIFDFFKAIFNIHLNFVAFLRLL